MDLHSAMETFAEAWVAANTQTPLTEGVEAHGVGSHTNSDLASDRTFTNLTSNPNRFSTRHDEYYHRELKAAAQITKSVPIHCLIEQVPQANQGNSDSHVSNSSQIPSAIEIDTYAIISTTSLFHDIVKTALLKLGYSTDEATGAKGSIQIRNWKPLPFDAIMSVPDATVGDMIGHLSNVATLRIKLYRIKRVPTSCSSSALDVKEKLLQILLAQSHTLLLNEGCPIDQQLLYALSTGCLNGDIPQELQAKFEQWYQQQVCKLQQQFICAAIAKTQEKITASDTSGSNEETCDGQVLSQDSNPIRTRLRTSFDTELELPLLNKWFSENPHPNRYQIQQYVQKLNSLDSRRDRKPLDVNNVVYWFKNARAAHKRAEQRAVNTNRDNEENHDFNNNGNMRRFKDYTDYIGKVKMHQLKQKDDESDDEICHEVTKENHGSIKAEDIKHQVDEVDIARNQSEMKRHFSFSSMCKSSIYKPNSLSISQSLNKLDDGLNVSMSIYELGRRKRNRTFIDPVSEVPLLERWFCVNSHPSLECILRYTAELNRQSYRLKFPKLEPKNVQFWFKNRRAKSKRLKVSSDS